MWIPLECLLKNNIQTSHVLPIQPEINLYKQIKTSEMIPILYYPSAWMFAGYNNLAIKVKIVFSFWRPSVSGGGITWDFQNGSRLFCGMGKLTPEPYECKANTLPTELLCPQPWKELIGKTDKQNGTHTKIYIKSGKLRKERREEIEQMRGERPELGMAEPQHASIPQNFQDTFQTCFLSGQKV